MIRVIDLSIGYHEDRPVLKGLNLSAEAGEMVALVGRNGSGKSTLLRTILGIQGILSGTCQLSGKSLPAYNVRQRARSISFVSAGITVSMGLRVHELLSLGRIPHAGWTGRLSRKEKELIDRVAREMGLRDHMDRPVEELSDGERQRAMIGRALVQDTPVILLDEPAAFLDIPHKYELTGILADLRDRGKTILYSTHDLEMAMMNADKFWVIQDEGGLEGAPEDLGLTGCFDRLFRDASIVFDAASGRFRLQGKTLGSIYLNGAHEQALSWTGHAMKRLGFQPEIGDLLPGIRVSEEGWGISWKLTRSEGEIHIFSSLYDLSRFLTKEH